MNLFTPLPLFLTWGRESKMKRLAITSFSLIVSLVTTTTIASPSSSFLATATATATATVVTASNALVAREESSTTTTIAPCPPLLFTSVPSVICGSSSVTYERRTAVVSSTTTTWNKNRQGRSLILDLSPSPPPLSPPLPTLSSLPFLSQSLSTSQRFRRRNQRGRSSDVVCALKGADSVSAAVEAKVDVDDSKAASLSRGVTGATTTTYRAVFDFSSLEDDEEMKRRSIDAFERIDDAVMGGISVSSLKDNPGKPYATWSGVCRIDGGGFCGTRTLPFVEPLDATDTDGIYVDCRLVSDNEQHRRVWKVTLRTDPSSRGEMVYQASFHLPSKTIQGTMVGDKSYTGVGVGGNEVVEAISKINQEEEEANTSKEISWNRIEVPFEIFQLVRGPRVVPNGPPLNVTGGICQIGLSLSKFVINANTTQLENFRPGYFELQLRQIGFYGSSSSFTNSSSTRGKVDDGSTPPPSQLKLPQTLSTEEMKRKRPILLKVLSPLFKFLFNEKANRRRSAMTILTTERGLTRTKAMLLGVRMRANSYGMARSVVQLLRMIIADSVRTIGKWMLRIGLLYPLRLVGRLITLTKKVLGLKVKELPSME